MTSTAGSHRLNGATRLGALAWLSAVQFFLAQVVVASAWTTSFSLADRYISDLGNTVCGPYPAGAVEVVCSPWHTLMNASFVTIGLTMVAGGILARPVFVAGACRTVAITFFTVAGLGVVLVGAFPENTTSSLHVFGASLNFLCGNLALVLFGLALPPRHQQLSRFSIVVGAVGLVSTVLFGAGRDLGLGMGAMERLAAYPMPLWQIVVGIVVLLRGR